MTRLRALLPYVLVLAAAALLTYKSLHFDYTPRGGRPGPDVWPRAVLALMIVACLSRIIVVLWRRDAEPPAIEAANAAVADESGAPDAPRYPWRLAAGIALTIAYVALLGILGFFVSTVLYIALLAWAGRYRRVGVIAAVAVAGALVFMFVFMKIVYLSLPIGIAPFSAVMLTLMQIMGIR